MSRYSIFGEKEIVAKSQWVKIYGTDDDTFTYNDKKILTESDLPPPFSVAPVGTTPNTAGLSFAGGVLNGQPADGTHPGFITTATQSFGGNKQFLGTVTANGALQGNSTLNITGNTTLGGSVTCSSGLTVAQNITGNGTLTIINDSTLGNVDCAGDLSVQGDFHASNAVNIPGVLTSPTLANSRITALAPDGTMSSYLPSNEMVLLSLTDAATTIGSSTPLILGTLPSPGNTGISISSNNIVLTKPGNYVLIPGMNVNNLSPPQTANLYMQMRVGSTPNTNDLGVQSDQKCGQLNISGLDNPHHFIFTVQKTTGTSVPNYVSFVTQGDSAPTAGTAPAWAGANFIQCKFNSSPVF